MPPSRRHYLQYVLLDAQATAAEREAARRELATGRDEKQETVAEWMGPRDPKESR